MASNVTNRQTIREALATLIDGVLDSTWDVFNYGTSTFSGKARNIVVGSSDTDYPQDAAEASETTASDAVFDFNIGIFILYSDTGQTWTAQNSEDALDLGRKKITDIVRDNRDNAAWYTLKPRGKSAVGVVPDEGGVPYRYEIVPVRVTIYS